MRQYWVSLCPGSFFPLIPFPFFLSWGEAPAEIFCEKRKLLISGLPVQTAPDPTGRLLVYRPQKSEIAAFVSLGDVLEKKPSVTAVVSVVGRAVVG